MLGNIWLKIKVFFLITALLALLSFLFFTLIDNLATNINLQQGADNAFNYLTQLVKNTQYERITAAFDIASKTIVTMDKQTRQVTFDTRKVDPRSLFAVLDGNGSFIAGTFTGLASMVGVPSVDRALRSGVASDGILRLGGETFLIGAVPFNVDIAGGQRRLIAVSLVPLREAFVSAQVSFPVRVHVNETIVYEFNREIFLQILGGVFKTEIQNAMEQALKEGREVIVNRWFRVVAFTMPHDGRSPERISFVGVMSAVPGFDLYQRIVTYIGIYAAMVIFITLVLTFLITYDIERGFKSLAADISRLRVGEKLLPHKYSHGAGLVVSAINHLIGTYQKHGETSGNVLSSLVSEKEEPDVMEIPEPSFDRKREPMALGETSSGRTGNTSPGVAKTVSSGVEEAKAGQKAVVPPVPGAEASADPFAALWETYKDIKIRNGEKISDQEKVIFLTKLKTNRVSIMNKYNCRDVSFTIEEKDGKPVIKAKPVR